MTAIPTTFLPPVTISNQSASFKGICRQSIKADGYIIVNIFKYDDIYSIETDSFFNFNYFLLIFN